MRYVKFDKVNMIYGLIATAGTAVFGKHWYLFVGFLAMNLIDWVSGIIKAKYFNHNENSKTGAVGAFKKVCYWGVIAVAFFIANCFVHMGEIIGVNLSFVQLFGWFTLASYLINEIRSILENFVEMHVRVPEFLINGLDITQKLLDAKTEHKNENEEEEIEDEN